MGSVTSCKQVATITKVPLKPHSLFVSRTFSMITLWFCIQNDDFHSRAHNSNYSATNTEWNETDTENRKQRTVLKLNLLHCWWYQNIRRQDGNKFYVQSLNCEFVSSFIWTYFTFCNRNNWSWINMCDADLKICYKPKNKKKKKEFHKDHGSNANLRQICHKFAENSTFKPDNAWKFDSLRTCDCWLIAVFKTKRIYNFECLLRLNVGTTLLACTGTMLNAEQWTVLSEAHFIIWLVFDSFTKRDWKIIQIPSFFHTQRLYDDEIKEKIAGIYRVMNER